MKSSNRLSTRALGAVLLAGSFVGPWIAACSGDTAAPSGAPAPTATGTGTTPAPTATAPAASCSDSIKNGSEADVDCGGSCATKCAVGKACAAATDCASGACSAKVCAAPSCTDAAKNGPETDVDCGGTCPSKCAEGKSCAAPADCTTGVCSSNKCVAVTCTDTVKNGTETDVDCGGTCGTCADGKTCAAGGDCASGVCDAGTKKCSAPVCTDTVKNGTETDIDCGGSCPTKCAATKKCAIAADCASLVCNAGTKTCTAAACNDTVKNGSETDIDCGGSCATKCAVGKACTQGADCDKAICTALVCAVPTSCKALLAGNPATPSGTYTIDPDGPGGAAAFAVYCDMAIDGGGWTLALNLDTSDGHVMWYANDLWTDANLYGNVNTPFASDFKGEPWNSNSTATKVLLVVHDQGAVLGWKSFTKASVGSTLFTALQGGDNTPLGTAVINSFFGATLVANERLVRTSTSLFANHCRGAACVTPTGNGDGDRIGSHEATPSDNNGGGLGNWHDMRLCCGGPFAGKTCVGATFRTTSEAQIDWGQTCGYGGAGGGVLGTDTFGPASASCSDNSCTNSNWANLSGLAYDYSIYLGE